MLSCADPLLELTPSGKFRIHQRDGTVTDGKWKIDNTKLEVSTHDFVQTDVEFKTPTGPLRPLLKSKNSKKDTKVKKPVSHFPQIFVTS